MTTLTIAPAIIGPTTAYTDKESGQIQSRCDVIAMGFQTTVQNPNKLPKGDYSSVTVEVNVKADGKAWRSKDGRSGVFMGLECDVVEIVAATPAKK